VTVRVGTLRFHDWRLLKLGDRQWTDMFIFNISANEMLFPPADMAKSMRRMCGSLSSLWKGTTLWVRVDSPGRWYADELRREMSGVRNLPIAVTLSSKKKPSLLDFSLHPVTTTTPVPPPPVVTPAETIEMGNHAFRCLLVLVRLRKGRSIEIAAQAGLSHPTALAALSGLLKMGLVFKDEHQWVIRPRKGLSAALRKLLLPPSVTINREKRYHQRDRHLRLSRLWVSWLRKGMKDVEIWAGWSEPRLAVGRLHPDALAWGSLYGQETLFWLEVETGNMATQQIRRKLIRRMNKALVYVRGYVGVDLVFAVAGPPWVLKALAQFIGDVPSDAAVILVPWNAYGERLPTPVFGEAQPGVASPASSGIRQLRLL